MKRCLTWLALLPLAAAPVGCNDAGRTSGTTRTTERTTTTTTRDTSPTTAPGNNGPGGNVNVNGGRGGAAADRTAANGRDAVDVDVTPGGGVDVDVQGQPIRDRIRERRAARDTAIPR